MPHPENEDHSASSLTLSLKTLVVQTEALPVDELPLAYGSMTEGQQSDTHLALRNCGEKFLHQYRTSKSKDDIDNSVKAYEQAVQFAGVGPQLADYQYDYATALLERYRLTQDLADIDTAICMLQNVVKATPGDSSDLGHRLGYLSSLRVIRYDSTKTMDDLSNTIDSLRMVVTVIRDDDHRMAANLHNISSLLRRRFLLCNHDLADISDAITFQQKLVDVMPDSHTNMLVWLDNLGASFEYRFQYTGDLDDLSKAISTISRAIELTPDGSLEVVQRLGQRGILYRQRFQYGGVVTDISDAVQDHENAIRIIPDDYPDLHELLGNLGTSYLCLYDLTENPEDISEAVTALQNALHLTPDGNTDIPGRWSNLGNTLLRRFECTGDPKDISDAIIAQQKAVELAPEGDIGLPSLLNNLGHSYQIRFDIAGDLLDISEAVYAHQKSIHLTPESHTDMSGRLSNLGIALQCRAERTGDSSDVSEAIDAHRKAVELCRAGHARMPILLFNLGNSIYARFKVSDDPKDVDEAISLHYQAIGLTGDEHIATAAQISHNLALALKNRFDLSGNLDDIDTAVSFAEKAVNLTREQNTIDMIMRLSNLGVALHSRFEHSKDLWDISKAISMQENAISLTPKNHPILSGLLRNMGLLLEERFKYEGNHIDIEAAISRYKDAALLTSGPPSMRLKAAKRWANSAKMVDSSGVVSLDAYAMAISLVSQVAGMEKTIGLRHRNLYDISTLSNQAAAAAFTAGRYQSALEWLEQGRCLVWNQLNNLRTPLEDLSSYDSTLAENFSRVSRELEAAGLRDESYVAGLDPDIMGKKMALQDEATANVRLAREWDTLLTKVRFIPEFKNFLRPAQYQDLVDNIPDDGHVVVINLQEDRCDAVALVAGSKDLLHIPLDKFSYDDGLRLVRLLRSFLSAHRTRTEGDADKTEGETRGIRPFVESGNPMHKVLGELWTGVVKPVLQAIGILNVQSSPASFKRIWWCPTGPLSFLPLHAAGFYNATDDNCISDYVISSYIPTVSSLLEKTRISRTRTREDAKVLVIGQADAPGLSPLPGTLKEVQALKMMFSSADIQFSCLEGASATIESTMKELETHSCIHFACHAVQDTSHPLKSAFYLSDGRLELWKMLRTQNRNAELAFLSACQTSKGNDWLSEEVVHLAAGMMAVGYRGVVATMWSIQDRYAVQVAEKFYSELFNQRRAKNEREGLVGGSGAAHALHYAVKCLRKELGDSPSAMLAWVPYVHMGV